MKQNQMHVPDEAGIPIKFYPFQFQHEFAFFLYLWNIMYVG